MISNQLVVNDFVARFLSDSLEKEGVEISPLEVELLYFFKRSKNPLTEEEIKKINDTINPEKISQLLKDMEKKRLILRESPYHLSDEGEEIVERCIKMQMQVGACLTIRPNN